MGYMESKMQDHYEAAENALEASERERKEALETLRLIQNLLNAAEGDDLPKVLRGMIERYEAEHICFSLLIRKAVQELEYHRINEDMSRNPNVIDTINDGNKFLGVSQ